MTRVEYTFHARTTGEIDTTEHEEVLITGVIAETDALGMRRHLLVEPFLRYLEGLGYGVDDLRDSGIAEGDF